MNIVFIIVLFSFSFYSSANNFLQVYENGDNSFLLVQCSTKDDKNTCITRNTSILENCIMSGEFTVFQDDSVTSANEGLQWTIKSVKKTNECTVTSESVAIGSEFTTTLKVSSECPDLLHNISKQKIVAKRLEVGKNPTLSTKNCKEIVWSY